MRLRNKKTGEVVEATDFNIMSEYNSLAKLNEEWEDYEEPKEWWYIDIHGPHKVTNNDAFHQKVRDASKKLGNYFESEEEAKKGIEKLKAFKRLKDKGFDFCGWEDCNCSINNILFSLPDEHWETDVCDDLNLLFGGEE